MMNLRLAVTGNLPSDGPDLAAIRAVADRLGRDFENYAAFALVDLTRMTDADEEDAAERIRARLKEALAASGGEGVSVKLDIVFEPGLPPSLADIDALARDLGVDRNRLAVAALAVMAEEATRALDDPEARAYWDAVAEEVAALPAGHTESM